MTSLPLAELVSTSAAVAATRSRRDKTSALAALFTAAPDHEAGLVVAYLAGEPPQGKIGVGWAALADVQRASGDKRPTKQQPLTVADLNEAIDAIEATSGPGSAAGRAEVLSGLFSRASEAEVAFMSRLLLGELRQGANEGLVVDGVAKAAGVRARTVRRALMLSGDLPLTAATALEGGEEALELIGLEVLRPLRPMLAATSADVAEALVDLGRSSVEWKLDGARIQVHKLNDDVRVWTRNLNEVTERLPAVTASVRQLDAHSLVLDGEAIGFTDNQRPEAFQDTMSRFGRESEPAAGLQPFFFDLLHCDGLDLIDAPLDDRLRTLNLVAGDHRIPGVITKDLTEATEVLDAALRNGHEGVMVKAATSTYEAGRRGKAWRKVKPVHTLDLVVIAIEWGHGRREGWLSNLHLGARGHDGGFVMVGKTFKGLTDEILSWQTERFLELETHREGRTVYVRPEQVVEIAVDGVQTSTRYPGGVALRFARVRGYRHDRDAPTADTIEAVRALLS